jgi:hypothetical protein
VAALELLNIATSNPHSRFHLKFPALPTYNEADLLGMEVCGGNASCVC